MAVFNGITWRYLPESVGEFKRNHLAVFNGIGWRIQTEYARGRIAERIKKNEMYSGLFGGFFEIGYSAREKKEEAEALYKAVHGDSSSLSRYKERELGNGELGSIYEEIRLLI